MLFTATIIRSLLLAVVVIVAFAAMFITASASSRKSGPVGDENSLSLPGSKPEKLIGDLLKTEQDTQQALTLVTSGIAYTRAE